jgi:hypothetical protein
LIGPAGIQLHVQLRVAIGQMRDADAEFGVRGAESVGDCEDARLRLRYPDKTMSKLIFPADAKLGDGVSAEWRGDGARWRGGKGPEGSR